VDSTFIPYGAPILEAAGSNRLVEADLVPGRFHLIVARMEPENNVDLIVRGYKASGASLPLVVVGSAPHAEEYSAAVRREAVGADVRFLGSIWDQDLLNQLYANSALYLHGHSVGGTNPSLLRAMGAAAPTAALDVDFNREVLGDEGCFFADPDAVAACVQWAEAQAEEAAACGTALQRRAARLYDWDEVAAGYEQLVQELIELDGRPARSAASR
jgi:glycosyltransferase involved in cell wall biosynthesis